MVQLSTDESEVVNESVQEVDTSSTSSVDNEFNIITNSIANDSPDSTHADEFPMDNDASTSRATMTKQPRRMVKILSLQKKLDEDIEMIFTFGVDKQSQFMVKLNDRISGNLAFSKENVSYDQFEFVRDLPLFFLTFLTCN